MAAAQGDLPCTAPALPVEHSYRLLAHILLHDWHAPREGRAAAVYLVSLQVQLAGVSYQTIQRIVGVELSNPEPY